MFIWKFCIILKFFICWSFHLMTLILRRSKMRIFSLKICKDALFLNLKAQKNALLLASFKRFDERIQTHHERIILYAKIIQPIYWFKMLLAIIRFHTILCVLFQFNFINACFIFEVLQKALLSNLSRCSDKTFKLFLHLLLLHLAIYWNLQRKYAEICKKKKRMLYLYL